METKLLPCPFCQDGGKPTICGYSNENIYYVKCCECGACSHGAQLSEQLAIEAWNTRHERTCEVVYDKHGCPDCGECGCVLYGDSGYCPSCGVRLKEEPDA